MKVLRFSLAQTILLALAGHLFSEEPVHPTFGVAFGEVTAVKKAVETLNADPQSARFPSMVGAISSDGVRVGDGSIELEGCFFDSKAKAIISVSAVFPVKGLTFKIEDVPPGKYKLKLTSSGKCLWSKKISQSEQGSQIEIKIPKAIKVSGTVDGIPVTANARTMVLLGSTRGPIDINGRFDFETYANDDDAGSIITNIPNPFMDSWKQPLIRYEFTMPHALFSASPSLLKVPQLASQINFNGLLVLDPELQNNNYGNMIRHLSIVIRSSDGKIAQYCTPDESAHFLGVGLPEGDYVIEVNDGAGNPPFVADPIKVTVGKAALPDTIKVPIRSP